MVPNLRDLLSQHEAEPVNSSCAKQNVHHAHQGISSGTSLAQLMSQHEQNSKTGVADSGRSLNISSLSTFSVDSNSSLSSLSNQSSLSLGTLASLKLSPPADTSTPSILSTSLSNLSLTNPSIACSPLAYPPGLGNLSSVLHNSQLSVAVPKGGPSLADLIQNHSNHSQASSNSLLTACGGIASVKCAAAAVHTPSLSELVSQHQNGRIPPQSTDKAANRVSSSNTASFTPSFLGGTMSLSELALQHQTSSSFASHQPHSTESQADALKRPPGLGELLPLSQLASEHKGKPSTTSNGSHCTLTSLPSPAKPEGAGVSAESTSQGGTKYELDHKPFPQISRPSKPGHTIDLSVLMAQASSDLPSPSSPTPPALEQGLSVFAKPSVFAVTLSFQSHRQQKRRKKNPVKGKLKVPKTESGYQTFSNNLQDKSKEHVFSIVPFRFDSPSPDDIVRTNQKKAFTR